MMLRQSANFLRLMSGVYGVVSTFLPWLIGNQLGSMTLWFTFSGSLSGSFSMPYPWYQNVPNGVLSYASNVFAITLSVMIFGCLVAFVSSFKAGTRGRWLAFSSGLAFFSAAIVFLVGLMSLYVSGDITGTPLASSSVAAGFCMAFVAAALAFASIGSKRNVAFFFLILGVLWISTGLIFIYAFHGPISPSLLVSFLFALISASVSACLYGVFKLVRSMIKGTGNAQISA